MPQYGWLLLALALLAGCAGPRAGSDATRAEADRLCAPHAQRSFMATRLDPPLPPEAFQDVLGEMAARGYSRPALEVADSIGMLRQLRELAALDAAGPPRRTMDALRRLRLRQAISDRILAAMLDVSASVAELDCEGERGDQLHTRLQGIEARRSLQLSLGSILAGALTAGVTGGLSLAGQATAASIAGIAGGATEASLAGSLLFGGPTGTLRTECNLLRELHDQPRQSRLFPATVWNYLTRARSGPDGAPAATVAAVLVEAWHAGDRFGPPGSAEARERLALVLGEGGRYGIDDLEVREAIMELAQTTVSLMSRDLRLLLAELQAVP